MVKVDEAVVLEALTSTLRDLWEETSFQLEKLQSNPHCVRQEQESLRSRHAPQFHVSFDPTQRQPPAVEGARPRVAVIREEGSNGDREMAAALQMAGFEVWDVNMQDLSSGQVSLADFRGVVFVGGFSYADVFGSAKGWAAALRFNEHIRQQFDDFRRRDDTFSLGVCNGCQLMALLGWVGVDEDNKENGDFQGVLLNHNESERFESRFVTVRVDSSPSIMLRDMGGSVLGVWVAHGEGRVIFKSDEILSQTLRDQLAPVRYSDDCGQPTTSYPMNPNGSPDGIAALCSADGRHLAMMPHPERCVQMWQWPWVPSSWRGTMSVSPWLRMFQNAFDWCCSDDVSMTAVQ